MSIVNRAARKARVDLNGDLLGPTGKGLPKKVAARVIKAIREMEDEWQSDRDAIVNSYRVATDELVKTQKQLAEVSRQYERLQLTQRAQDVDHLSPAEREYILTGKGSPNIRCDSADAAAAIEAS